MTRDPHQFTDAELTAFLDGQASEDLSARITARLDSDPALADRVQALDAPVSALREALSLDAISAPAMPAHLTAKPRMKLAYIAMPAAIAASFLLGLLVAPDKPPAPMGWIDQVASYQALYVTETLAGDAQDPALTQNALMQAQAALEFDFNAAPQIEGLTFKRAQMLAVGGEALVQLAYLDDAGVPFALCITRVANNDRGMKTKTSHDLAAASWVEDGLGYVLIGGQDATRVGALAEGLITAI